MMAPPRLDSLTALRGLLAVWVVLYHFANDLIRLFPAVANAGFVLRVGHFAVPGFFMLSGYVLAYTYSERFGRLPLRGVFRFWAQRLGRIYPVHFATLIAVLVMVFVAERSGRAPNDPTGYSARDFALNLLLIHAWVPEFALNWNYPSWSISSEWFAYLLFPFLSLALPPTASRARAAIAAVFAVAALATVYSMPPFPFRELICVVPTFIAGMSIHALTRGRADSGGVVVRWVPEAALFAIAIGCAAGWPGAGAAILVGLFILIGALVKLGGKCHRYWLARPAVYLGEVSYSLYMTHTLAQKLLYKLLPVATSAEDGLPTRMGVALAYAGLIVGLALAMYYTVEKPSREWIRRRLARRDIGP